MAGERIMEALDLADAERLSFKDYEDAKARSAQIDLQPPPRNPVLAAYDMEPEAYVLRVVERVQSTALQDALLVLPFGKVVSLMSYLNIWAQRVSVTFISSFQTHLIRCPGMEHKPCLPYNIFSDKNPPPPDSREPGHAHGTHSFKKTFTHCSSSAEGDHWIQFGCLAVHPPAQ
jgi:hypothetical protein